VPRGTQSSSLGDSFMGVTPGASRDLEASGALHPGAELVLLIGMGWCQARVAGPRGAAEFGGPRGRGQQSAESPGQAAAGGRGQYQQRRQREEAEHDERRGTAVRKQRFAPGARRGVDLRTQRAVRQGGAGRRCRAPPPKGSGKGRGAGKGAWPSAEEGGSPVIGQGGGWAGPRQGGAGSKAGRGAGLVARAWSWEGQEEVGQGPGLANLRGVWLL
jgi:hypothetical protein